MTTKGSLEGPQVLLKSHVFLQISAHNALHPARKALQFALCMQASVPKQRHSFSRPYSSFLNLSLTPGLPRLSPMVPAELPVFCRFPQFLLLCPYGFKPQLRIFHSLVSQIFTGHWIFQYERLGFCPSLRFQYIGKKDRYVTNC